ncbi:hypothetical protein KPC_3643 [Acinetobacter stercoris]|uniref:Uncharacterized protein n=1 Tax=Acinetobacter stercoris TaxID=2126983 RepID=A0A2U3N4G4_9GAMM|nr:hypothetical protein KPC_3643 [Acinetobacter stercoris]
MYSNYKFPSKEQLTLNAALSSKKSNFYLLP